MRIDIGRFAAVSAVAILFTSCSPEEKPAGTIAANCDGQLAIVRLDTILLNGSLAGVEKAAADQLAWYRNNGYQDNAIVVAPVFTRDPINGNFAQSTNEIMTIHVNPPNDVMDGQEHPRSKESNDAWAAFVKEYDDNSKISTQRLVCLPKFEKS